MKDCELQLLAAWISGFNQEHIRDFEYFTYYPEIYDAVRRMKDRDINPMSIAKATGIKASDIAKLMGHYMPSLYDGAYRQMKEDKIKSLLMDFAKDQSSITPEKIEVVFREFETLSSVKIKPPTDLCEAYKREIDRRTKIEPLKYGLPTLDYTTGGLRPQELTVIAARPSVGKTNLALQVGFNLALKKNNILFFSLEMAAHQLMERLVCRETQILHEKLKTPSAMGPKDKEQLQTFFELYGAVMKTRLNIIEGVRELSAIKRHIEHYKPVAVIIDQLTQLTENKRFNSKRDQFSYMTNNLKSMTMDMDIPIILLTQLNRDAQNREPTLADLKESGSIEEDADNVLMLHETDQSINDFMPVDLIIRKQRNGQKDIKIECLRQNSRFVFRETSKNKKT